MTEWRWEQEDATTIQKIMRGFLVRKEQKGVEWDEGFGNVAEIWTMMTQESCSWERWASEEIQRMYRGYAQRKWWPGIRIKGRVSPPVAFNCYKCSVPVIRDSEKHDHSGCNDDGDWFCPECFSSLPEEEDWLEDTDDKRCCGCRSCNL